MRHGIKLYEFGRIDFEITAYNHYTFLFNHHLISLFYKWFRLESCLQVIQMGEFFYKGFRLESFLQVIQVGELFKSGSAGRVCFTSDSSWRVLYKWWDVNLIPAFLLNK
jgi:hypothetical protein